MNKRKFWGGFLMTAGGLMSLLSGGCALSLALPRVIEQLSASKSNAYYRVPLYDVVAATAMWGGIPCIIGLFLFYKGWKVWKRGRDSAGAVKEKPHE